MRESQKRLDTSMPFSDLESTNSEHRRSLHVLLREPWRSSEASSDIRSPANFRRTPENKHVYRGCVLEPWPQKWMNTHGWESAWEQSFINYLCIQLYTWQKRHGSKLTFETKARVQSRLRKARRRCNHNAVLRLTTKPSVGLITEQSVYKKSWPI